MSTESVNKHSERSGRTRRELLAAARGLFAARGYAAVSIEDVVRQAGVTRGALYHQFAGKAELFEAVLEQVEDELIARIGGTIAAAGVTDPLAGLGAGIEATLDAALDPEVVRITLLDAPAVLGWERWRAMSERYGLGLVRAGLDGAVEAGSIPAGPAGPLAQLLLAGVEEAMLIVARAEDPRAARDEASAALGRILDGLRA